MVDTIFNDSFWKDKMDSFGPIIKAPHKWIPVRKSIEILSNKKVEQEIGQYIWYEIFQGDPLDKLGKTTESNIKEAIQRYHNGEPLVKIYEDLRKRSRNDL
jgi:hypothetical protein